MSEYSIHDLVDRIREHINRREKQANLMLDFSKWAIITSALDVLADTTSAIEFYLESDYPLELGNQYLTTYGLFQCIMLQQDATTSISTSILGERFEWKDAYPAAYQIREIRNDIAGHPTNRNGKASIQLVQHSLSKNNITYLKSEFLSTGSRGIVDVDVIRAINETKKSVNDILKKCIEYLDVELRNYKDQHKQRKMSRIFDGLNYAAEKVLLHDEILKDAGYQHSKNMVRDCEEELVKRFGSIDVIDSFSHILEQIKNVYDVIDNDLHNLAIEVKQKIDDCLYQFLFDRLEELRNLCNEIDKNFDSD